MTYLFLLLTLLGSAFSGPLATDVASITRDDRAERYVLPSDSKPTSYDVTLFLDPGNPANFTGEVSIRILPLVETNEIVMHAMEMLIQFTDVQVFSDREPTVNLYRVHTTASDDTHLLRISLSRQLTVMQPITVHIKYTAQYAQNMFGVYVSTYQEEGNTVSLVTSQLQPTFARRAFPCYDEPHLKAVFRTTIYAPPQYDTVRSNMPLREELLKEDIDGWTKHEFADTPEMSTYLIAYLVSNFPSIGETVNPLYRVPLRIYSRPNTQDAARFALDFGQRNMAALEEFTDFEYILPKMDKAAVPDFAAGAMENWGLVIYREVALLLTEGVTSTSTRQNIGRLICHENVHQWFGNEVSPRSWTYTWLNEGFANFFENYATDLVVPEWRMMDQFVLAMQNVFQSDAVLSVNPMTHPVYTPSEILGTFNAVAYQKSGSVIRMMQHFLTPEVFRQGLINYIKAMSRGAATPEHLYAYLQIASLESNHTVPYGVPTLMSRWANQGGFPVVTISRGSGPDFLVVEQERFLTDRSLKSEDLWYVPLNWVLSTDPDFSDTKPARWLLPTLLFQGFDIPGLSDAEWYIFNKQQTGYYRVNYDEQNWAALVKVLAVNHEVIHHINRGMLLDDSFNLARNGRLNYSYALDLSLYLVDEKDYIPWGSVNPAYTYLDMVLSESEAYPLFQRYIRNLTEPLYNQIGFEINTGEEFVTAYHRNIILDLNCRHGNEHCISTAANLLDEFRNNPTQPLNPDIQGLVYCSGLRGGNVENFSFLWNIYLNTADSSAQSILLNALGCTSNEERRSFYLNQVISDSSQVREQDRHTIIVSVTNASPDNMNAALDFIIENFHLIQPRVQGLTGTTNILNAFARRLTSQAHSDKVDELYRRHQSIFTAGELASIAGIRENIAASITWSAENAQIVEEWLEKHYADSVEGEDGNDGENGDDGDDGNDGGNGSATSLTTNFIVMISVVITIFNLRLNS